MNKMLAFAALLSVCAATAHADNIHTRERRQQQRIAQGVRTGNLTPLETARLENKEADLRREIRRDRMDGPGLTLKERQKIERQQNRISRDIYRESHDSQVR
jgi:hypothetical protein